MPLHLSLTSLLAGALSISAALAWNEAVRAGVRQVYPQPRDSAKAAVVYAIFVTIFVVAVVAFVNHVSDTRIVRGAAVTFRESQSGKMLAESLHVGQPGGARRRGVLGVGACGVPMRLAVIT